MIALDLAVLDAPSPTELRLLREVASLAKGSEPSRAVLVDAIRRICEQCQWAHGEIWLPVAAHGELRRFAVWDGPRHETAGILALPSAPHELIELALWKRSVCSRELADATTPYARVALRLGFQRVVAVPLVGVEAPIGVIVFLLSDGESLECLFAERPQDTVVQLDCAGRILTWSRAAERMFGWGPQEALHHHVGKLYSAHQRACSTPASELTEALARGRLEVEGWRVGRDGNQLWTRVVTSAILDVHGRPKGFVQALQDRTSSGRRVAVPVLAQTPLRRSSSGEVGQYDLIELRTMFDGSLDALVICDDDARYVDANEAAVQLFGVPRELLIGKRVQDIKGPAGAPAIDASWAEFIRTGRGEGELEFQRPDGETRIAEYRASANILPGRHLSALRDVTERRRAERSSRRLAAIVESATDAIDGTTLDGTIDYWSPAAERLYGYTAEEAIGCSKTMLCPIDRADELEGLVARVRGGELVRSFETIRRRKDGSTFAASITLSPIREDGQVIGISAITRDISEQKQLEARLAIADRMASVGLLAAGVGHEISNPLAALVANLDLLHLDLAKGMATAPADMAARLTLDAPVLEDAREAAERISVIVRDLKMFSRSNDSKPCRVEIRSVLESTLRMASHEIRHRARLVCDFQAVPVVDGSNARLGQVMLNLVLNAAQSIRVGDPAANEIRVVTRTDDTGRAIVEVSDSGVGIEPEHLAQIFEPFFTTKSEGLGTGLGLSISRRIVQEMGGEIDVHSTLGRGTTFRLALPATRSVAAVARSVVPAKAPSGRILVIDDEPMIAAVVERILGTAHSIEAVTSASEALRRIAAGACFDVILCDLMMPEMTGIEFHAALRVVATEQADRIVFFTGGVFDAQAREFFDTATNACLEKPFHAEQLRTLMRARIGPRPAPRGIPR